MEVISKSVTVLLLLVVVLSQLPNYSLGEILVSHRVTKKLVLTVQQDFIPFDFPLKTSLTNKTHLIISDPANACNTVNPPPSMETSQKIYSVEGSIQPNWVLLVDDSDCDLHLKLIHAQLQGYSGVIIYSLESSAQNPMPVESHLTHLYKISVSFIGLSDGLELQKYVYPKLYNIKIEQDWTLSYELECFKNSILEKLELAKKFITEKFIKVIWKPLFATAVFCIQILLLSSPIWFLLFIIRNNKGKPRNARNTYREWQQYYSEEPEDDYSEEPEDDYSGNFDFNGSSSYERTRGIPNDPPMQSSSTHEIDEYRKMLGVSRGCSKDQIESAFRKNSPKYHPDKNLHLPKAEIDQKCEYFKKMTTAKEELLKLCV